MSALHKRFPILSAGLSVGLICIGIGYVVAAFVAGDWPDKDGRLAAVAYGVVGFLASVIREASN